MKWTPPQPEVLLGAYPLRGLTAGPSESELKPVSSFSRQVLAEFYNADLHYTNLSTLIFQSVKRLNYWLHGRVNQGSIPGKTNNCPDRLWSPPSLSKIYRGFCPRRQSWWHVKVDHLSPSSAEDFLSLYKPSAGTSLKTPSFVKEACLQLRCVAMGIHVTIFTWISVFKALEEIWLVEPEIYKHEAGASLSLTRRFCDFTFTCNISILGFLRCTSRIARER
jgi:hypothetical protein